MMKHPMIRRSGTSTIAKDADESCVLDEGDALRVIVSIEGMFVVVFVVSRVVIVEW